MANVYGDREAAFDAEVASAIPGFGLLDSGGVLTKMDIYHPVTNSRVCVLNVDNVPRIVVIQNYSTEQLYTVQIS
jgi:hypothetical protein